VTYHSTESRFVRISSTVCSSVTFVQVWSDGFHQRTSLLELGHSFYIGHQHTPCPSPNARFQKILIIDHSGAHHIKVQFCACKEDPKWIEHYCQLLRMKWYPASFNRPRTAFTFDILDTYHKITLQGKLNLYDFYKTLMQKSDNCGRKKVIVSKPTTISSCLVLIRSFLASIS